MRTQETAIGDGYLTLDNFKRFIDMNPFVKEIETSFSGEIFLNPQLADIIKYAHERGVTLSAQGGVNMNYATDEALEAMVTHKFKEVIVSIDGSSQEAYSWYRQNGDFDKVISNLKKLLEFKKKHNSEFPHVEWKYIILESTQGLDEIRRAKRMAEDLGIRIWFHKDFTGWVPDDPVAVEQETGLKYTGTYAFSNNWKDGNSCYNLWYSPQINWDGRFFGCWSNPKFPFGPNVFEVGLETVLKSKEMRQVKDMLFGKGVCNVSQCHICPMFHEMQNRNDFLTENDVVRVAEKYGY